MARSLEVAADRKAVSHSYPSFGGLLGWCSVSRQSGTPASDHYLAKEVQWTIEGPRDVQTTASWYFDEAVQPAAPDPVVHHTKLSWLLSCVGRGP